jgi:hypothetical protein
MLSNLRHPNRKRVLEALTYKLRRLIDSGQLDEAALRSDLADPASSAWLPEYNVIEAHNSFRLSPLYWLAPDVTPQAFADNWSALTEAVNLPEAEENAFMREYLRHTEFQTVRSRLWLLGPTTEHKFAQLIPVLQQLVLQAARFSESPPQFDVQRAEVTVEGRLYSVHGDTVLTPRAYGGGLVREHHRSHQWRHPSEFRFPKRPVTGGGVRVLAPLFQEDPELPAILHSVWDGWRVPRQAVEAALDRPDPAAVERFLWCHTPTNPIEVALTPLERLAMDQPPFDLEAAFQCGAEVNLTALYALLVLETRSCSPTHFRKVFGPPSAGSQPRVERVTRSGKYLRWKEKVSGILADAPLCR